MKEVEGEPSCYPGHEILLCECHLLSWGEFRELSRSLKQPLTSLTDLSQQKIAGHGCGQCLKTWEDELKYFLSRETN